jgi:NAD(P)H dehydrogenase (quinone)
MNQVIILAHPKQDSFSARIKEDLQNKMIKKGNKVKIRDLYKMNFNPVLNEGELAYNKEGETCPDVIVEQNYILWADQLTFIYPLWWNAFPAILKGYIDRVFTNGFAFKITENGLEGLLKKKVRLITTAGMTEESLRKSGVYESLKITQDEGVFEFCGMDVTDHIYIPEVTSLSEEEKSIALQDLSEEFFSVNSK